MIFIFCLFKSYEPKSYIFALSTFCILHILIIISHPVTNSSLLSFRLTLTEISNWICKYKIFNSIHDKMCKKKKTISSRINKLIEEISFSVMRIYGKFKFTLNKLIYIFQMSLIANEKPLKIRLCCDYFLLVPTIHQTINYIKNIK